MRNKSKYHLIHVTAGKEFLKPLVLNQVFERANYQAVTTGSNAPLSVSVWIIEPMRIKYSKTTRVYLQILRKKFPNLNIKLFGGIGRLSNFPLGRDINRNLNQLRKGKIIFHVRGESAFEILYANINNKDNVSFALDIRGYWPLEILSNHDIYDPSTIEDQKLLEDFQKAETRLKNLLSKADGVFTVSNPLKKYLEEHFLYSTAAEVVPCCVGGVSDINYRERIRKQLNLQNKYAFLYLGSVARYQHIEDLVLPFLKSLVQVSNNNIAVLLTQDLHKMKECLDRIDFPDEKIIVKSIPKEKVNDYCSAMDAGLLLRAPSLLNSFAQPVKFGEYLSNGLPVIVERGTGEIERFVDQEQLGYVVNITNSTNDNIDQQALAVSKWVEHNREKAFGSTRAFVKNRYTWLRYVNSERVYYQKILHCNQN